MLSRPNSVSAISVVVMVAFASLSARITPAFAQDPVAHSPLVHLSTEEAGQFQHALDTLAKQAHVAFVAEGAPLAPKLNGATISSLKAESRLDDAVSKIAGAYDYNSQRRGNVFVLTKRYTKTKDLPCVTLKECQQAADTVSTILDTFNPNFSTSLYASGPDGRKDAILSFFHSLSAAQMEAARTKKLTYGSLLPAQQTLIQKLFLFQYVQRPFIKAQEAINYLDYARKSAIMARDKEGQSGLFMEAPDLLDGDATLLVALMEGLTPVDQKQPSMLRDLPAKSADPVPARAETLGSVISHLKPINGNAPAVDEVLEDKPVTVAGIDNVESISVMEAFSVLYKLDLLHATSWEKDRLKPYHIDAPLNLKDMDAAIWAAIPISYIRALHLDSVALGSHKSSSNVVNSPDDGKSSSTVVPSSNIQDLMTAQEVPTQIKQEANNCLLLAIQPQLKKDGVAARVPVSTLDSRAKAALALSLMTDLIRSLQLGFSGFPHQNVLNCLDNMDQTIIYSIPGEEARINNQTIPSIYLEGTDPTTTEKVGLGGARYFGDH